MMTMFVWGDLVNHPILGGMVASLHPTKDGMKQEWVKKWTGNTGN